MSWDESQKWEKDWWGDCTNTLTEEEKQLEYAKRMGLIAESIYGKYPVYRLNRASVLDVGGGPVSILLKCIEFSSAVIVEPLEYPSWVMERYWSKGIRFINKPAEDMDLVNVYDEVWCYNVLQHTKSPQTIISNMRSCSKIIRIFEWINTEVNEGHPHSLTEDSLNEWLGGVGKTAHLNERNLVGDCYYGIFRGDHYV